MVSPILDVGNESPYSTPTDGSETPRSNNACQKPFIFDLRYVRSLKISTACLKRRSIVEYITDVADETCTPIKRATRGAYNFSRASRSRAYMTLRCPSLTPLLYVHLKTPT